MTNRCIVTVSFGDYYKPYRERLARTVSTYAGSVAFQAWYDCLPPNSPSHKDVPYGFKLAAIEAAKNDGYESVLWLDSGAYLTEPLDKLWDIIEQDGYYFSHSDQPLSRWIGDKALGYFKLTREFMDLNDWRLLGGMPYGFSFAEGSWGATIFSEFKSLMETGLFARDGDHRHDEAALSVFIQGKGHKTWPLGHLYSGIEPKPGCCIASGYDLDLPQPPEVIANHTVRFPVKGIVLDVGAHNLEFATAMAEKGCEVVALDPLPQREPDPKWPITVLRWALVAKSKDTDQAEFCEMPSSNESYLKGCRAVDPEGVKLHRVEVRSIEDVMAHLGIRRFGLVKLNCEGAEFDILREWPGPIASQVTVAFHEHVIPGMDGVVEECVKHMSQWYDISQHVKEHRYHCSEPAHWDTRFTLKREYELAR